MNYYIGEIRVFAGDYAPRGWAFCNGSLLSVNQNQALFSLISNYYGGDGRTNFALPDYRMHVPVGQGQLANGENYIYGENAGMAGVALSIDQIPSHTHSVAATTSAANTGEPNGAVLAATNGNNSTIGTPYPNVQLYTPLPDPKVPPNAALDARALGVMGGSQQHSNMMPYVVVSYIIAVSGGLYPTRS